MQGSDTPTPQASAAGTYPVAVSNVAPTATDERTVPAPAATVAPEPNMHVTFRGDAKHAVLGFASASGQSRVSLVLEQYRVDERLYPLTLEFDLLNDETRGTDG